MEVPKGMALVTNGAEELIPTQQYGNLRIGPATVSKLVADNPEAIAKGLEECWDAAQEILAKKRKIILEIVKASGAR